MPEYTNIGKTSDFTENHIRPVEVGENKVAVVLSGGRYYAFSNVCTHLGIPLTAGVVYKQSVGCVFHNSYFSMETGEVVHRPGYEPLTIYDVRVEGDDVLVGRRD